MAVLVEKHMDKEQQYKRQNDWINERYIYIYITIGSKQPRDLVAEFKEACKKVGVSQSEVFKKAMLEVIEESKK